MASAKAKLEYPIKGLSETYGFAYAENLTSRDERNMRSIDPTNGRIRGAQRAGLGLHAGGTQLNSSNKIKAITAISKNKTQLTWAANDLSGIIEDWTLDTTPTSTISDIVRDEFGVYYAVGYLNYIYKINADGGVVDTISVPIDSSGIINGIAVDRYQNIYLAVGNVDRAESTPAEIYAYELQADDTYKQAWIITRSEWSLTDIAILPGAVKPTLYVTSSTTPSTGGTTNIHLHVYPNVTMSSAPVEDTAKKWTQAVGLASSGGDYRMMQVAIHPQGQAYVAINDVIASGPTPAYQAIFRVDPQGSSPASSSYSLVNDGGSGDKCGIGIAITIGETEADNNIVLYTAGDTFASNAAGDRCHISKLQDNSTSILQRSKIDFGVDSTGWRVAGVANNRRLRIAMDEDYNIYVPYGINDGDSAYQDDPIIFADAAFTAEKVVGIPGNEGSLVLAAAVPPTKPDYGDEDIDYSEFVIYGGDPLVSTSIWSVRLATVTQSTVAPRDIKVLGASGNTLKLLNSAGTAWLSLTGGGTLLDGAAPYAQMVPAFGKIYIVDGKNNLVYDPDTGDNGTASRWVSSDMANVPKRCRLIESWRGRIVVARDPEDPSAWHMSKAFDPLSWNNFPQNPSTADAISSRNSRAGGVPDIINTIVPYNDDLLLFGGDSSIWQLTGDPRAGGQLDLITDSSGMAFGRPWCKDPTGRLWFFGSHGDLYLMAPGSPPISVSAPLVPRQLQEIDLGTYYVSLVWNYIDHGVHIFVCPFGAGGTLVDHWFYDVQNNAFHKDRFGGAGADNIQPTAAINLNGDLYDDRAVLIGGEDGRLRRWGKDTAGNIPIDDEQTTSADIAIDSYVTAGPVGSGPQMEQMQITDFSALLGETNDGCSFELFASDNPEALGAAKVTGSLTPGRNNAQLVRVSGDNLFMRLRNASLNQRWSYEVGSMTVSGAGAIRRDN